MASYTLHELAKASGETRFTIRHYVQLGFLPAATGSGANRHFTDDHLYRLRAMRSLRKQGLRHTKLVERLNAASAAEIRALAGVAAPPGSLGPTPERRRAVQALVIAAADAMDAAPKRARAVVVAVIEQMKAEGLAPDEALPLLRA